jgi:hypothetical protein
MSLNDFDGEEMVRDLVPIWPEDVLTEAEWEAGWLDRQIIAGRCSEADRATTPSWLGGNAP